MQKLVLLTEEELKDAVSSSIKLALYEFEKNRKEKEPEKTYTINQVAKKLGMSFSTAKKRIEEGYIKAAKDGRIPQSSITNYLRNQ
ncbi:MAG TPA: hypothetical protein DCG75_16035 [Bacteroidales bacterium]|nr:hypothetical protein [Bacteroidales bacterium]